MRAPLFFAVLAALTACQSTDMRAEFALAVSGVPGDGRVMLEYRDGHLTRYAASMDPDRIPAAARRTADEIVQPGGKAVFAGSEWSPSASGYRFVKVYADPESFRTVLVAADGKVLARSHQIPAEDVPAAARDAVRTIADEIRQVEVVQRKRGTADLYRFGLTDAEGRRWYALTTAAGFVIERGREVDARIFSGAK